MKITRFRETVATRACVFSVGSTIRRNVSNRCTDRSSAIILTSVTEAALPSVPRDFRQTSLSLSLSSFPFLKKEQQQERKIRGTLATLGPGGNLRAEGLGHGEIAAVERGAEGNGFSVEEGTV